MFAEYKDEIYEGYLQEKWNFLGRKKVGSNYFLYSLLFKHKLSSLQKNTVVDV